MGHHGILRPGDIQWMTAGSGIIHDEGASKAHKAKGGVSEGFQIWVNLPRAEKMCDPAYQDVPSAKIEEFKGKDFLCRVICGEAFGKQGAVQTKRPVTFLDFHASKGATFAPKLSKEFNLCVYVYRGKAQFGKDKIEIGEQCLALFAQDGDTIDVTVTGDDGARFLLLGGVPLNEPIVRHGPFVMNTREEARQAFQDYTNGTFVKSKPKVASATNYTDAFDPSRVKMV